MSLHNHLQKLLVKGRLCEVTDDNMISLKGGQGKNRYSVDLTDIDAKNISVINLGKNPHSSLINEYGGYKKICDYLILVPQEKDNRVVALLCELKKTYNGSGHDQLHASIPFLDYIKSLLHTHFDENRQFKHQFIIIASKMASRFDKQPVRPDPIQKQTINFKHITITLILGETIPFNKILI